MHDKFVLNAAIEKLISNKDPDIESAEAIIKHAHNIPVSENNKKLWCITEISSSKGMLGHTPEQGNISVNDSSRGSEVHMEGWYLDRVGNYKIWKENEDEINFKHWKDDLKLLGREDEIDFLTKQLVYFLIYDIGSLEPRSFGHIKYEIIKSSVLWLPIISVAIKRLLHYIFPFDSTYKGRMITATSYIRKIEYCSYWEL